ncbi:hypothetical protein ACWC2H_38390, partial [Streptomyces sp. 900105755]
MCGRIRAGNHIDGGRGAFHCDTCIPRPLRGCGICGRLRPVKIFWPLGPVCSACYRRRRASPSPCAGCSATRILVGITDDGDSSPERLALARERLLPEPAPGARARGRAARIV